jgi:hypothetical protein
MASPPLLEDQSQETDDDEQADQEYDSRRGTEKFEHD